MKKIITVFLVLALAAGMGFSPTAYAASGEGSETITNGSAAIGVGAKYQQPDSETKRYYITITNMPETIDFTCSIEGSLDWIPQTMTYVNNTNYVINNNTHTVTVTNQSNAPIWVAAECTEIDSSDKQEDKKILDDFDLIVSPKGTFEIESAENCGGLDYAPQKDVTLQVAPKQGVKPDAKPEGSSVPKTVNIGTLTIRLSSTNPSEGSTETTEASTTQSGSQP